MARVGGKKGLNCGKVKAAEKVNRAWCWFLTSGSKAWWLETHGGSAVIGQFLKCGTEKTMDRLLGWIAEAHDWDPQQSPSPPEKPEVNDCARLYRAFCRMASGDPGLNLLPQSDLPPGQDARLVATVRELGVPRDVLASARNTLSRGQGHYLRRDFEKAWAQVVPRLQQQQRPPLRVVDGSRP